MSSASDVPGLHRCPVCFKTYKRREHLQRHRTVHSSERPHRCILCNASFQRSDVLKRHLQTCDGAPTASGRRRACDRCVRQKKACSSSNPCENCARRGVECQYSNISLPNPVTSALIAATGFGEAPGTFDHGSNVGQDHHDGAGSTFNAEDVHFDDLDALIHDAISGFPLLVDSHMQDVPEDWLGIHFPATQRPDEPARPERSSSSLSDYHNYFFHFLYDFTSRSGLVSSFDCATLSQREQIISYSQRSYLEQQLELPITGSDFFNPAEEHIPLPTPNIAIADGSVSWPSWLHNPIVVKLQQIVLLVKEVVTVKPNNSTVTLTWSPTLEQRCLEFFSPSRFSRFIDLYWSVWHPNVSIVHRPSFDPTSSKAILLAAMALIGACVSPDPIDNEDARMWFNCVEEMVFTDDDFCSDTEPGSPTTEVSPPASVLASRRKLQALQASYIVCLYQNWEGNDTSKRRIRRHRFSTVVSVARDMGISTARHLDYSTQNKHDFNWLEYIVREELIRTFLWIFLLDTAFVIFNNIPHRMVIKEMRMHMASPEACFQAQTAEECISQIHRWMAPSSPFGSLLLREALENVCTDSLSPEMQQVLSQLGPLNLFAIVSAFHYMIFQHQNLFGVEGQLVPIRNGLRNWIAIWEMYYDTWSSSPPHGMVREDSLAPETMWKRGGFIRYSPEYWLLGSLLTDRISSATSKAQQSHNKGKSPQNSQGQSSLSSLTKSITVDPILDKYDQTSMRQVNDLITEFQKFQVD
ncbi:hypothetical protein B0H66DRAFT_14919 [Apodospora peruviana]|uniref:Uncharacterized protein n=1 Tax=Apodospora peruviana TaxID=516989 RepID=A0AAE0IPU8_9PEZI|nr:hypothetical protein B0H66DRAFT_14919 [Apodospora peruviana]